MSFAEFRDSPWAKSHPAYRSGAFAMTPAPENSTSEVVLSSLYRVIGLPGVEEKLVPSEGTRLQGLIRREREKKNPSTKGALDADGFDTLLNSLLESPKRPNQSAKRFLQVTPLVPQVALFSGSPRLNGNPWTPGTLVRRMIWLGSPDVAAAQATWRGLFDALTVGHGDDVFARFLQSEVEAWLPEPSWTFIPAPTDGLPVGPEVGARPFPARQFVEDLNSIIAAKDMLTRRQWTSLLEAILRLGTVAHVMWLCEVHSRVWACLSDALRGAGPATEEAALGRVFPEQFSFLPLSSRPLPGIRDSISRYLTARLGINAVLWALHGSDAAAPDLLGSARGLANACAQVRDLGSGRLAAEVRETVEDLIDRETRTLLCRRGVGKNIDEFVTYSLQQRLTANPRLRGYDQGYILRKRGAHSSSPWIVSLGPVATIALVHCSLSGAGGPRSVHRLAQHLGRYGVTMDHREIPQNELGHQLRMLGLVLDSPDAESGMLLVPPFRQTVAAGGAE
ncbi:hypothetical protein E2493_15025 [Sphingomonas parva]|uniref:Uncharacterized protein n=1 Tax=Sphingomonas parva TaxID=2555898 RepID=A0A4Y8ZNI0_9SPHN|nr:hypothetical protein [Sphingomonas parva]TFI57514.1 hypothetical protein E2493_15025 [Sphingomonas parva]